jgi:hypothetical protein
MIRAVSIALAVALFGTAIWVGGGIPLSPASIAEATRDAADNAAAAARNTERAARSTRALATITRNVRSQVRTSRFLLETQMKLQASSERGADHSREIAHGVGRIRASLTALGHQIRRLTGFSSGAATSAERSAGSAGALARTLDALRGRFDEVMRQSRELNRKARGYDEARDGPG